MSKKGRSKQQARKQSKAIPAKKEPQHAPAVTPAPVNVADEADHAHADGVEARDKQHDAQRKTWWAAKSEHEKLVVVGVVNVVLFFFYTVLVFWQATEMRKGNANAIRALEMSQRAEMGVIAIQDFDGEPLAAPRDIAVTLQNTGHTSAHNARIHVVGGYSATKQHRVLPEPPPYPSSTSPQSHAVVGAGSTVEGMAKLEVTYNNHAASIMSGAETLFVYGNIAYGNGFSDCVSTFCFSYEPARKKFVVCANYNSVDCDGQP